jgi:hypothetical protein
MPLSVSVDNNNIRINRIYKDIVIPVKDIEKIKIVEGETRNSIRTFGSGGFFGALGKFRNDRLGDYKMYVTDASQAVLVKYDGQTIVFGCDNPEKLVEYVNSILKYLNAIPPP